VKITIIGATRYVGAGSLQRRRSLQRRSHSMAYALALDLIMTCSRVRARIAGADCNVHGHIRERLVEEIAIGTTDADEIGVLPAHRVNERTHIAIDAKCVALDLRPSEGSQQPRY
jgi:hypothetical protein